MSDCGIAPCAAGLGPEAMAGLTTNAWTTAFARLAPHHRTPPASDLPRLPSNPPLPSLPSPSSTHPQVRRRVAQARARPAAGERVRRPARLRHRRGRPLPLPDARLQQRHRHRVVSSRGLKGLAWLRRPQRSRRLVGSGSARLGGRGCGDLGWLAALLARCSVVLVCCCARWRPLCGGVEAGGRGAGRLAGLGSCWRPVAARH